MKNTDPVQLLRELAEIAELNIDFNRSLFCDSDIDKMLAVATRARQAADEIEGRQEPTDGKILAAVRHLYGDDKAAAMGAEDDIKTARAVLARLGSGEGQ